MRRAGPRCRSGLATGARAPAIALGVRDYSRTGPWGPIVEKRRLASYDEALFIITTSPLDSPQPHRPSTPIILPSGDSWYLRDPGQPVPMWASFAKACVATGCTATSAKFAPDKKLFSARARGGQRGHAKSICDPELDIERYAWAVSRGRPSLWATCMRSTNGDRSRARKFASPAGRPQTSMPQAGTAFVAYATRAALLRRERGPQSIAMREIRS